MAEPSDGSVADPAAVIEAAARFLCGNGVRDLDDVRAFLGLDLGRDFGAPRGGRRRRRGTRLRPAPRGRALALYLSAPRPEAAADEADAPPRSDALRLIDSLRRFASGRLAALAGEPGGSGVVRDVVDLTRCLKELAALEAAARAKERSEADAADMACGAPSDLAEIVALQVERLHRRCAAGGDLETLYPPDEGAPRT